MHRLLKAQYEGFLQSARRTDRNYGGKEICGLIIDTGYFLSLVEVRNISRRAYSFRTSPKDVRKIAKAAEITAQEIVGTFHSHPVSIAKPGPSDIRHAVDDSLMLIFDCMGGTAKLWKIKHFKARELRYVLL
jgi:proteasome lid subunit RPN8/RPN11